MFGPRPASFYRVNYSIVKTWYVKINVYILALNNDPSFWFFCVWKNTTFRITDLKSNSYVIVWKQIFYLEWSRLYFCIRLFCFIITVLSVDSRKAQVTLSSVVKFLLNIFKNILFFLSGNPWFAEKGWRAGGRDYAAEETDQSASELTSHSTFLWVGQDLSFNKISTSLRLSKLDLINHCCTMF